jgi:C-terminal processing protease CtpA/Prc
MRTTWPATLVALGLAGLVGACGGGGGGGSPPVASPVGGSTGGGGVANPTWTSGVYSTPGTYAAHCARPRTGTDPATGAAYPDVAGTTTWENHWLRAWSHAYYLWYSEVPDVDPATVATPASYFDLEKTSATTPSGTPKDRFHFTYPTATWQSLAQSGVQIGYGAEWALLAKTPPRKLLVAYTDPGTPAVAAGVLRGAEVLTIDGVDLVNAPDQASVDRLNAGLTPATVGESHTFGIRDPGSSITRTVTLVSQNVTSAPVQNVQTIPTATGMVGYLTFNDHLASAERPLVDAFQTLANAGVTDLVLDIRYNGGGYLDLAAEVAYMIAGPARTSGQTFELQQFNSQYTGTNPITGQAIAPTPFFSTSQGFSVTSGTALPTLNLSRVYLIVGSGTCSASEAIINGLRGVGVDVELIGGTTCGKPYGFYPADNCGTTYFSIQFRGVNAQGFGDYSDGFQPGNGQNAVAYRLPGCAIADDYGHALGDSAEGRLAGALAYRASGNCPVPTATAGPAGEDGLLAKPAFLTNRLARPAAR